MNTRIIKKDIYADPKKVYQVNCVNTLKVGQLVYLDSDGNYKPAYSPDHVDVVGVVWDIIGSNIFYLKMNNSSLSYRYPLSQNVVPGNVGDKLYLSTTVAPSGNITNVAPTTAIEIGYKTPYGFNINFLNQLVVPVIQALNWIDVPGGELYMRSNVYQWQTYDAITGLFLAEGANWGSGGSHGTFNELTPGLSGMKILVEGLGYLRAIVANMTEGKTYAICAYGAAGAGITWDSYIGDALHLDTPVTSATSAYDLTMFLIRKKNGVLSYSLKA